MSKNDVGVPSWMRQRWEQSIDDHSPPPPPIVYGDPNYHGFYVCPRVLMRVYTLLTYKGDEEPIADFIMNFVGTSIALVMERVIGAEVAFEMAVLYARVFVAKETAMRSLFFDDDGQPNRPEIGRFMATFLVSAPDYVPVNYRTWDSLKKFQCRKEVLERAARVVTSLGGAQTMAEAANRRREQTPVVEDVTEA